MFASLTSSKCALLRTLCSSWDVFHGNSLCTSGSFSFLLSSPLCRFPIFRQGCLQKRESPLLQTLHNLAFQQYIGAYVKRCSMAATVRQRNWLDPRDNNVMLLMRFEYHSIPRIVPYSQYATRPTYRLGNM